MKYIEWLKWLLFVSPFVVKGGLEESQNIVLEARQYNLSLKETDDMFCKLIEEINLHQKDGFGALCYVYNIAKRNNYINAFKSVQIKARNVSLEILEAYLVQYCELADRDLLIFILDKTITKQHCNEFSLALSTYHSKIKSMQDKNSKHVRTKIFNQIAKQYKKLCSKDVL